MKKYIYMSMAIAATMFAACSSDDDVITTDNNSNQGLTIVAKLPQESAKATTRVSYEDNSSVSGYSVTPKWESGDYIRLNYIRNDNGKDFNSGRPISTNEGAEYGSFYCATIPKTNYYIYCFYPNTDYSAVVTDNGTTSTCQITLPDNNSYIFTSIGDIKSKNILTGSIKFNSGDDNKTKKIVKLGNIYALLKFTVKIKYQQTGTISKITSVKIQNYKNSTATNVKYGGKITLTGGSNDIGWTNEPEGEYSNSMNLSLGTPASDYREAIFYALVNPQEFDGIYLELGLKDNGKRDYTATYKVAGVNTLTSGYMYGIKAKFDDSDIALVTGTGV